MNSLTGSWWTLPCVHSNSTCVSVPTLGVGPTSSLTFSHQMLRSEVFPNTGSVRLTCWAGIYADISHNSSSFITCVSQYAVVYVYKKAALSAKYLRCCTNKVQRAEDWGFNVCIDLRMNTVHAQRGHSFSLVTVLAKLFHRPLDVSWGPTQRLSGGRSGTLRDTWSNQPTWITNDGDVGGWIIWSWVMLMGDAFYMVLGGT